MKIVSRTQKSLKNSVVALFFFTVQFILGFYSRKVFLDYLGTEILGLNTTLVNILQFLNLAEMGIGTAVGFTLYKPIADADHCSINEIVTLQGHLYKRIANFIIGGSCIVMCLFPWIFHKTDLPLWYAYASFAVILFSSLLGYYVNYRQIVLTSAQMDYKVQYSVNSWAIVKIIFQIIAVSRFNNPYVWWLVLEFIFSAISAITLAVVTRRSFPFLSDSGHTFKELKTKYSLMIVKIKQLFVHQIGAFALSQSSTLIIYAYASLTLVAIYGNYIIIVNGFMRLVNAVFNSIGAGIGNLVAENDINKEILVFKELFSIRFLISATIAFSLIIVGQPFITVWIGSEYVLPISSVILIAATLFIRLNRATVNNFINAKGLYQDIWAPLAEAGLNIGLSILLGYFFGLNGILAGVLCSLVIIVDIWKPYMLFHRGFFRGAMPYFKLYSCHLILGVIIGYVISWCVRYLPLNPISSWTSLSIFAIIIGMTYFMVLSLALYIAFPGMRMFVKRFIRSKI